MTETLDAERRNVTAWVAIWISVVGLIATNGWAWTQFSHQRDQIATQKAALSAQQAALSQAEDEFQQAHGALSISAVVEAADKSTGDWTASQADNIYNGKTLDADFYNSHDTYVMIVVVNKGTGPTDITFAGLVTGLFVWRSALMGYSRARECVFRVIACPLSRYC